MAVTRARAARCVNPGQPGRAFQRLLLLHLRVRAWAAQSGGGAGAGIAFIRPEQAGQVQGIGVGPLAGH